jgi:hypothetical protein
MDVTPKWAAVVAGVVGVSIVCGAGALAGTPPGGGTNLGTVGGLTYMFRETAAITPPGFAVGGPACPADQHVVGGGLEAGSTAAHIFSTIPRAIAPQTSGPTMVGWRPPGALRGARRHSTSLGSAGSTCPATSRAPPLSGQERQARSRSRVPAAAM